MERDRRNGLVNMLSRSPFPSVNSYIALSFVLWVFSAGNILLTFHKQPEVRLLLQEELRNSSSLWLHQLDNQSFEYITSNVIVQCSYYILNHYIFVWIAINTYFAWLALSAKFLIDFFCRELTRQEEAVVRHGFFSFLLFSIVFLSVLAGANKGVYVLPWLGWFGFIGFLTILHQVAHQRFKFVSPSSGVTGGRLSWLCFLLFATSYLLLHTIIKNHQYFSLSHFLFLLVDSVLSLCRSVHGLLRCLSVSDRFNSSPDSVRHFNYWLDLVVAIIIDAIQLVNYVHLMFYSPIGFNLTCVFFFYHIKLSYGSMVTTLARHRKHNQIFQHITATYPMQKAAEDDLCIVCWEQLGDSRRLPCSHQFHDWCLMWWLAQDASCPTCRRAVAAPQQIQTPAPSNTTTVRFGGGFGFLRLPSFAIEVSTGANGVFGPFLRRQLAPHDDSQLMGMAQQVREMFPQLNFDAILDDLRISGSAQGTIENILEGRVGFVGGLPGEESEDDDSWHADDNGAGLMDDDLSASDEETHTELTDKESAEGSDFALRRKEMIAKYRLKYINSRKGEDLRERGIHS